MKRICLKAAVVTALLFIPNTTLAQIQIWNGTVSTDWATASNWDTNSVPTTGDQLQITGTGFYDCIADNIGYIDVNQFQVIGKTFTFRGNTYIKNSATIRDFEISGNGVVTIEAGATAEHTRWTRIGSTTAGTMNVYGTYLSGTQRIDIGFDGATGSTLNIYDGGLFQSDGGSAFNVNVGCVINIYEGGTLKKADDQTSLFGNLITLGNIQFPEPGAEYSLTYESDGYTYLTVTINPIDTTKAHSPNPQDEGYLPYGDTLITWTPGDDAVSQHFYICADFDEIQTADTNSDCFVNTYPAAQNSFDTTAYPQGNKYYWRIDTVTPTQTIAGDVWSFNKVQDEIYAMDHGGGFPVDYVTIQSLQGLANRSAPRLYIYKWSSDLYWLQKLPELEFLGFNVLANNSDVFTIPEFSALTDTMVVYDKDDCRAAVIVALTAAGILDSLVVENDDIAYMQSLAYSIHTDTRADMRGLWSTNEDAVTWAYTNLRSDCIDTMYGIDPVQGGLIKGADYFVANTMFVFPLDAHGVNINYQTNIQDQILSSYPAGSKSHGWWSKEVKDVHYISEFGHTVGQLAPNTSFFSKLGQPDKPLVQKLHRDAVVYDPSKTYITISFSQGDSLHFCQKENLYQMINASTIDPNKTVSQRYPFGQMHSTFQGDLQPTVVKHLYAVKPDHMLFTAKGYGYTNPTIQWENGYMDLHCTLSLINMNKMGILDYMLNDNEATDVTNLESIRELCHKIQPRSIIYKGQLDDGDDEDDPPMVIEGVPIFADPVFGIEDDQSNFYVQDTVDNILASAAQRQFFWVFLKHSTNEQEAEQLFEALKGYPQFVVLGFNSFIEFYREHAGLKDGDIDDDGHVNFIDFARIAKAWNQTIDDPGFDPACDISYPRGVKTDSADLAIVIQNWLQ